MSLISCPECGREYQSRSGLRRHMKSVHGQKPAGDAEAVAVEDAAQDAGPKGAGRKLIERALVDLGIDWEDVMSYRVHDDRIVIVEGPVGFKRTWWFPASGGRQRW